ncbi:hypothetical protein KI809_15680 [Geobacter pelophilus]|uniref:Uncharacterized protein n=1 Tax=Geoanaerobacter pelophilus TaxID=60036 RepID=A0AAW4L874_9BACT|nr:hypothetical protein [Geoanaerobacter pelophilus]MBT0665750.1 hypothetical protein [Geoanaerobacter pelophilus]
MTYTIRIREQIAPKYIVCRGPSGPVNRLNIVPVPPPPSPAATLIWSDLSGIYEADPTKRVELWEDPAGVMTDAEVLAQLPELCSYYSAIIRAGAAKALAKIAAPYLPEERESWFRQYAEAVAWEQDKALSTPYCDRLLVPGEAREALLQAILDNTRRFEAASTAILQYQRTLIAQIWAATTVNELVAIVWPQEILLSKQEVL